MSRRTSTLAAAGLLVLTLVAVALLLPVPYVTMRPGPTVDVLGDYDGKPVLEIEDAKTYPTDGQIRLTTVSVTRADSRVSLPQAFIAYFNSEEAVVPRDLVYPKDQTAEESRQENAAQMASSKLTSEAAALTEAGYDVTSVVEIAAVSEDGPSAGVLEVDDVLVSVDGQKVTGTDQAVRLVSSARPGAVITLGIRRDGSGRTVKVTSDAAPDDPSKARIGVSLGTDVESPDRYVFRLVHQAAADGGVTGTELATHIGVAVCLRDGRATQAARFSYLHSSPSCTAGRLDLRPVETSIATDRARWRGDFAQGADTQDEPTPRVIGGQ